MSDSSAEPREPLPLLTATDAKSHVHLIIGSNPLAAARCAKSLEVGAIPILIAPSPDGSLPSNLSKHVDSGAVRWIRRDFRVGDLSTLGRDEVYNFVDAVFVTLGRNYELSMAAPFLCNP